jgi:hypothetical protein
VIRFAIQQFSRDLRSTVLRGLGRAIEQERADMELEREWRLRVAENIRRRIAAGRFHPNALR